MLDNPDQPAVLFFTEAQVAAEIGVGRRSLQRWRTTGDGPAFCRLGRRRILYRRDDVEAWAAARRFEHRADELSRSFVRL